MTQCRTPAQFLAIPQLSCFSLFNLEMNRPDDVAESCTHCPQLSVYERKEKLQLELKLGKEFKRIPHKYGHNFVGFFPTLSQPAPTTRLLRLLKMIYNTKGSRASEHRVLTFALTPVAGPIIVTLSQRVISKSDFKDDISSSALLDIQLTLLCVEWIHSSPN